MLLSFFLVFSDCKSFLFIVRDHNIPNSGRFGDLKIWGKGNYASRNGNYGFLNGNVRFFNDILRHINAILRYLNGNVRRLNALLRCLNGKYGILINDYGFRNRKDGREEGGVWA